MSVHHNLITPLIKPLTRGFFGKVKLMKNAGFQRLGANAAAFATSWWVWKKDEHGSTIPSDGKKVPEASQPLLQGVNAVGSSNSVNKSDGAASDGAWLFEGMPGNPSSGSS